MTREEHVKWCKDRAMDYVKHGDLLNAVTSMMSDMDKHPDTKLGQTLSGSDCWPRWTRPKVTNPLSRGSFSGSTNTIPGLPSIGRV